MLLMLISFTYIICKLFKDNFAYLLAHIMVKEHPSLHILKEDLFHYQHQDLDLVIENPLTALGHFLD